MAEFLKDTKDENKDGRNKG